jgi:hypothetical protein
MKKTLAVAVLSVLLAFGTASQSFAATRDGFGEPGGITSRIVRVIKQIQRLLVPRPTDDTINVPKP